MDTHHKLYFLRFNTIYTFYYVNLSYLSVFLCKKKLNVFWFSFNKRMMFLITFPSLTFRLVPPKLGSKIESINNKTKMVTYHWSCNQFYI